jgi:hypothetical protein
MVSNVGTLIMCYECGWNLLLGVCFQQFLIDGQRTTMYSGCIECFQFTHINIEPCVKYYFFKQCLLWMIFCEWTSTENKIPDSCM